MPATLMFSVWGRSTVHQLALSKSLRMSAIGPNWKGEAKKAEKKVKAEAKPASKPLEPSKPKRDKLSWKEQRELEALPERIAGLEAEQAQLTTLLEDPAIYQRDAKAAQQAAERLAAIDDELLSLLERWEVLESRAGNSA